MKSQVKKVLAIALILAILPTNVTAVGVETQVRLPAEHFFDHNFRPNALGGGDFIQRRFNLHNPLRPSELYYRLDFDTLNPNFIIALHQELLFLQRFTFDAQRPGLGGRSSLVRSPQEPPEPHATSTRMIYELEYTDKLVDILEPFVSEINLLRREAASEARIAELTARALASRAREAQGSPPTDLPSGLVPWSMLEFELGRQGEIWRSNAIDEFNRVNNLREELGLLPHIWDETLELTNRIVWYRRFNTPPPNASRVGVLAEIILARDYGITGEWQIIDDLFVVFATEDGRRFRVGSNSRSIRVWEESDSEENRLFTEIPYGFISTGSGNMENPFTRELTRIMVGGQGSDGRTVWEYELLPRMTTEEVLRIGLFAGELIVARYFGE
ncbi:MAG: hypothetical protein FWG65_10850 [Turicibacter sp.]|nr:hypothetical protein [Turicibacter sp.]